MSINVSTHLNFDGNARKALMFYHSVFGGDLSIVTYEDAHNSDAASAPEHVIWGQVHAANGFRIMAFDVGNATAWNPGSNAFYLMVEGTSTQEIAKYWKLLVSEGIVIQALESTQWSPLFGMVKDHFGVVWVLSLVSDTSSGQ